MCISTVTNSTFRLFDSNGAQVSGSGTATFTPSSPLSYGQHYTAKLDGSVADGGSTTLGSERVWSFAVGIAPTTDPHAAPQINTTPKNSRRLGPRP